MHDSTSKRLTVTFRGVDIVTILHQVSGQVRPGEMLLVLGRPGSGCTSLLKVISNSREEFHAVNGDVRYGDIDAKHAKRFRQHMVMNTEDDLHFPL
ncbi:ABC multidrug transporter atrB like protein [Verticillium longisporum]|nr:ABC multidrug transporter atrB like protein [Verticillium longisporum]